MDKQIVITGSSWERGGDYSKTTKITDKKFEYIRPVIERISHLKDNWTWDTELVREDDDWVTVYKVYKMHSMISPDRLREFAKYVPQGIDKITGIKIQKISEEIYM